MEGRKQKAREGKWNGGVAPFGYRLYKDKGILAVDPGESEIVKVIFDLFAHTNMGGDSIAGYLNSHGYVKNCSRDFEFGYFSRKLILKILDNPVYIGKIAYGRTTTEKVKGKRGDYHRMSTEEYLLAEGQHDAIIDEVTWDAVRTKRTETGIKWVKTHSLDHEHILSGLVKCPTCGTGMIGMFNRYQKKNGEYRDIFYYGCNHRKLTENGCKCDNTRPIRQDKLNEEVEKLVLDMVHDKGFCELVKSKMYDKLDMSNLERERDNLKEQLRQVEGSKRNLIEQMDALDVSDRHYNRKYQDMQDKLDSFYDRINELEAYLSDVLNKMNGALNTQITTEGIYRILLDFDMIYSKMSDFDKKMFFRNLIKSIEINPDYEDKYRILKHIDFNFPVCFDAKEDKKLLFK